MRAGTAGSSLKDSRPDIPEQQGEGEPLNNPSDAAIARPEQQAYKKDRLRGSPPERTDPSQELCDVSHTGEIRGDVDDIGDDKQRTGAP